MAWFPTPIQHRIYCVFRDNDKADIEISEDLYNIIRAQTDSAIVTIEDKKWRILFEGKRKEITEFKHIYPKEDKTPDEYKLYSAEFKQEKEKRTKFFASLRMDEDQKDTVWSIILSRWGKTYSAASKEEWWWAWKSFFRWMFEIITLEKNGYRDKISSKDWIIKKWKGELELPDIFENVEAYRTYLKNNS